MAELTLEWVESGVKKSSKVELAIARIGRDPARCDLVLSHPTVSGLHVVIYFDPQKQSFWIRNMRESNPPIVDGHRLEQGEIELQNNSAIALGQQLLQVTQIQISPIEINPPITIHGNNPVYGLQCPNFKCAKISSYEKITLVCPWCGTSLAGAASSILPPH
ncbi:FHA domain-containing protein [Pseudanabaena sp. FACHB-1998]|uniref:FHA domain-containing protein n=1 Tax=Pseudanabaena sp. FACHB-1998 TaxID=2692858 RepID=UPI0016816D4E|nr:FHA domain-containing protein [Pseudanabaena sp. FACHB-1998]MBD2179022.1 FHA domain-containing protein [Pseudanabaena sp. FACHB-1998]